MLILQLTLLVSFINGGLCAILWVNEDKLPTYLYSPLLVLFALT